MNLLRFTREFEIGTFKPLDCPDSNWWNLDEKRTPVEGTVCEFGMAEEVIGWIKYSDGTHEVGVGECLRPYDEIYKGKNARLAKRLFYVTCAEHISL